MGLGPALPGQGSPHMAPGAGHVRGVLVRRVCGLGDLILTIPWLKALRRLHRAAVVHILGHAQHAELLRELGLVEEGFPEEGSGWHSLYVPGAPVPPRPLRPDPSSYQRVYVFLADPHGPLARTLRDRIGERFVPLPARPDASAHEHAACLPFRAMGLDFQEEQIRELATWDLGASKPSPKDRQRAEIRFLVHPGSGSPSKNWPAERFAAIMEMVSRIRGDARWAVIQGPSDGEPVATLLHQWRGPMEIFRPSTVAELALYLRQGSLFVGNDSGVTHLAAFLGVPTLAVFGPSDPLNWAPLGPLVRVAFKSEPCHPCHGRTEAHTCQKPCERFPSVQQAWEALLSLGVL